MSNFRYPKKVLCILYTVEFEGHLHFPCIPHAFCLAEKYCLSNQQSAIDHSKEIQTLSLIISRES